MSIQELITAARTTKVTQQQVKHLREKLEESANEQSNKSTNTSKSFLARTYSL